VNAILDVAECIADRRFYTLSMWKKARFFLDKIHDNRRATIDVFGSNRQNLLNGEAYLCLGTALGQDTIHGYMLNRAIWLLINQGDVVATMEHYERTFLPCYYRLGHHQQTIPGHLRELAEACYSERNEDGSMKHELVSLLADGYADEGVELPQQQLQQGLFLYRGLWFVDLLRPIPR